uniref:Dynein light chain roadblock-type 2 n=23 Tax=Amniota TaxID=32524 RepID=A0A3Q2I230_HORSE
MDAALFVCSRAGITLGQCCLAGRIWSVSLAQRRAWHVAGGQSFLSREAAVTLMRTSRNERINGRTNDPEVGLRPPLLGPIAPRAEEKRRRAARGTIPKPRLRRPGGGGPGQGGSAVAGGCPTRAHAGAAPTLPGGHFLPCLLATAGSVVDVRGSGGAGLSPESRRSRDEVEETLKRIQTHKGVIGTMVVNAEGIPIRTTLDNSTTVQYAGLLHQLTMKARSTVRDIDPQNDLTFLRIRSKKHEIMVAPDKEYLLIVIQNPCE